MGVKLSGRSGQRFSPPPKEAPRCLEYRGGDPEELSALLSTTSSPLTVTPQTDGTLFFNCRFFSVGGTTLAKCTYGGDLLIQREVPSDKLLVFLPISGEACFGRHEFVSLPGTGTILEGEAMTGATRIVGPRSHFALFLERRKITHILSHLLDRSVTGNLDIQPTIDLTAGAGRMLMRIVDDMHSLTASQSGLEASPLSLNALYDAAIYLLLENCHSRYSAELASHVASPSPRHVKWAIDFMHENISAALSLTDIAVAAKVSVRTLQQGFREFQNTTPMAYLQDIRLAAAHDDLLHCDPGLSVADIACKWGFSHMGRFAADYSRRFGQLPSQTRRRY
ncbi:hypothetical protein L905_20285 [Agrobacterium sp. TS43]|uniref:AraC family transcriptional regulator n=1 Tax=Agrobacterium TaxID=357 RepID=UPI000368FAC4|nr:MULTISPECIES: AraC family transcriptional regulator [Agrobacterium]EPR10937.1 hypothetical protein L902_04305 [Agrobacterium radiobacter DSM 30147]KDR86780.1 AraC family transcriptional regulator [Agrobacterium tumefaciens GW4]KVK45692.1 hypothetical protein L904_24995 [Agrobacterium sp. LY4]KVK45797.1 hypothetical protein L903_25100 [Agrobacterium sp. JL28]KVK59412.1 hypothetical protein L906_24680 [Agrobacterium sp. TS45]